MLAAGWRCASVVTGCDLCGGRVDGRPFEIDAVDGFYPAASPDEVLGWVRDAVRPAVDAAKTVLERVKEARPDEVELKFGIKVSGSVNWLGAKAASDGHFEVTLRWRPAAGPDEA
jgi:hypothetical protein